MGSVIETRQDTLITVDGLIKALRMKPYRYLYIGLNNENYRITSEDWNQILDRAASGWKYT